MQTVFISIILLSCLGAGAGMVLYAVAKRFDVVEDPRIDKVQALLPGVNCGGCGYPGCRKFAEACVQAKDLDHLFCPVGGNACMALVAGALGIQLVEREAMIAVLRCHGTIKNRPRSNEYDGTTWCKIVHNLYAGETGCGFGCLGFGDCVRACKFGAIAVDPATRLPVIHEQKCVACGACVKACPRTLIELRLKGPAGRRIYVRCSNPEKGSIARKNCSAACIGCGKCFKACSFGAITMGKNLAYIDFQKCTLCGQCVSVCPTQAIYECHHANQDPH